MTERPTSKQPAAEWVYRGIWKALADWFNVPETPPDLPTVGDETTTAFHPSRNYLKLLKLEFWIVCLLVDAVLLGGWLILTIFFPIIGAILLLPVLLIAIVPDVVAYIAIHLKYDCTWYVMSPRSLRVRRGVWIITEQTITFENVQNVSVVRGPIQQLFGIATVKVSTAGGGASDGEGGSTGNVAILAGVDNPADLRDRIMARVRASKSAGLGDDRDDHTPHIADAPRLGPAHLDALRAIRDDLRAMV